jgi:hypothetical protein
MKEDVTEFEELKEILGYTDERSVIRWCKTNNIPVLKMGFKKYILSHNLTQYIDNQLVIFVEPQREMILPRRKKRKSTEPVNEIYDKYLAKYEANNKKKAA